MKKRVGIILDSLDVSKQIYDFINLASNANNYQISTLIINETKNNKINLSLKVLNYIKRHGFFKFYSTLLFKTICKLEQLILNKTAKFSNFYKRYKLNENDFEIIYLKPILSKNGLVYRYEKSCINLVIKSNLDLLIRGGSGILKGEILTVCPHGIISFHHADNDLNRGGPPGFWEVFQKNPRTGFIIQRLRDELDGGDVLFKGFISTSFFYSLNLAKLYELSNPFLHYVVEDILSEKPRLSINEKSPYSFPLYKTPSAYQSIIYLLNTCYLMTLKILRKFTRRSYRWGVAYQFVDNWREVTLWRSKKIPNPKNRYLADPFIIKRNGEYICFVEDYNYYTKKGSISAYKIDQKNHQDLGIVLSEDFHISFPFLFEYEEELYMCPETYEKNEIRIYKCLEFPTKWIYKKTIMKNVSAVDTIIFKKNKKWWLLTNIDNSFIKDHSHQLHIFYSDSPLSEQWTPHIANPVIYDSLIARNGGLILENDNIYRVFQSQDFDLYGASFGVSKINLINNCEYKEKVLFKVQPKFFKNILGTHTYNFKDGLIVIDFLEIEKRTNNTFF
tara:strand:- start:79 stop:1758 length:1680 start_codon:yes stop_codon:yes gene_type:complete